MNGQHTAMREEILGYYAQGKEDVRLGEGGAPAGRLEFWRTQDVMRRLLPAHVLDVGSGSGVHAEWLAQDGYQVELIDPVPLHVEQAARIPGATARLGNAREPPAPNAAYDAVLMLGPPMVAAAINRYAQLHDLLREERCFVQHIKPADSDPYMGAVVNVYGYGLFGKHPKNLRRATVRVDRRMSRAGHVVVDT
ncbi:class I SAM-dependent methyltransferase [Streptomyces sp. NPDC001107]